jgi:hypothetical protein
VAVSWIAFAAILLSPLRSGEVVRPYLITRRGSVRLWEATGTIGAERIIDGLFLSVVLFVALQVSTALDPLPSRVGDLPVPVAAVPGAAYGALLLFAGAFAVMTLFFWRRDLAQRLTRSVFGLVSKRLAERAADAALRVADGLRFLPSPGDLAPFLLETAAYWAMNAFGLWILARGVGLDAMTVAQSCVLMGTIGVGILIPAGPGFFGAFQLSAFMALAMYFPEDRLRGAGAAFVFLLYVSQLAWTLIAAGASFVIDPSAKDLARVPGET